MNVALFLTFLTSAHILACWCSGILLFFEKGKKYDFDSIVVILAGEYDKKERSMFPVRFYR